MRSRRTIVRFYDLSGNLVRTDAFELQSNAGLWLRINGYTAKGAATKGTYYAPDGYAKVDYAH